MSRGESQTSSAGPRAVSQARSVSHSSSRGSATLPCSSRGSTLARQNGLQFSTLMLQDLSVEGVLAGLVDAACCYQSGVVGQAGELGIEENSHAGIVPL